MNAYRQQQLAAAALIESGDYTAEQIAAIYGWTARAAPEQPVTTGHNWTQSDIDTAPEMRYH